MVGAVVPLLAKDRRPVEPILTVLLYASLAAGAAGFGVVPLVGRPDLPIRWIGWANALAGGLMLGTAFALAQQGLERLAVWGWAGAVLGIIWVYFTHAAAGTGDLDLNRLGETGPEYGYQVFLVHALHAVSEGVAIGVAMLISLPFGIVMALAIAVHNVPEATVLSAILTSRGVRMRDAAGLAIVTNVTQVLLAVVTFAIASAAPALLPWAWGFAVGGLVYLVLVELLPQCYRQAGHTSIALVTSVATVIVVLLAGAGA